tara:strand:- start:125 stop:2119 length:1995 start_codon:yes stop_codon:yes gene_type:complete
VANILTPNVVSAKQLIEILREAGIDTANISTFAKNYGISNPKKVEVEHIDKRTGSRNRVDTLKNSKSFYNKPTATELKKIKEQYDINILKKTDKGPGKIAFDKRKKKALELLKTKNYTIAQANEILKREFPEIKKTGMNTTLQKLAKNIKGIPSGKEGDTATTVTKVVNDLKKLNKSEIKKFLRSGKANRGNLLSLIKKTEKLLGVENSIAARRLGQLIEAYAGDSRYLKVKDDLFLRRVRPLIDGIGKVTGTRLYGGIGGGIQRMAAEDKVSKDLGKTRTFFSNLRKRIQERIPGSGYETDEIKNLRSSARFGTSPYSLFVQGIRADINQDKSKTFDKQTSIYEKKLQNAKTISEKRKIANEYNQKAKAFAKEANKNLKPGQLPVRTLEISFDAPNKVIKNKNALFNYGDMFDDIYKKHGYSFKVPADVKTIEEVKPFLEGGRGLKQAMKLIKAGAPRMFGIGLPLYVGYLAYQDFKDSKEKESEPRVQTVKYDKTLGAFVNPADDVVSQASLLNWVAENPIKSVAGTTAPALLTKKGRALGKSALAKTAWLATPLPLAGSLALTNQDRSASEMLSDPWNWAGVAAMDTATKATGLADKTGKLASTMRLGMSPGMIRGASRFLGLPGLALSLGMSAYDQYKKYQDKEGFVYDLFNEDVDTTTT